MDPESYESSLSEGLARMNFDSLLEKSADTRKQKFPGLYPINASTSKNDFHEKNVYIRGLPADFTDDDLYKLASSFGTITSSKAITNETTRKCKGYGFVMYKTIEQAEYAVEKLKDSGYQVSFAKDTFKSRIKDYQDNTTTNIYISNIPVHMNEANLIKLFDPYKTTSVRILRDHLGNSRRVGFARMESRDAAEQVIRIHNLKSIPGSSGPLKLRFADSTTQKKMKKKVFPEKETPLLWNPVILYQQNPVLPPMAYSDSNDSRQAAYIPGYITQLGHPAPVIYASPGYSSPTGYMSPVNQASSPVFGSPVMHPANQQIYRNPDGSLSQGYTMVGYGSPVGYHGNGYSSPGYISPMCLSPQPMLSPQIYDYQSNQNIAQGNTESEGNLADDGKESNNERISYGHSVSPQPSYPYGYLNPKSINSGQRAGQSASGSRDPEEYVAYSHPNIQRGHQTIPTYRHNTKHNREEY
ncbi:hypothetical protein BB559_001829 [Furculomyces boomerangus]|uniref:RRM domain-containing protein n=1 Tax=Furculomyces boomerangus TaxID=61424 RepID=A0A2T9Z054_9FUNG|nr:hypothetical protein BB559_001829 [Furculomyces boomerangus]